MYHLNHHPLYFTSIEIHIDICFRDELQKNVTNLYDILYVNYILIQLGK